MPRTLLFILLLMHSFYWSLGQSAWERGQMKDGKPIGIWEYYDDLEGKELGLRFNYDSSRISYVRPDTSRYFVRVDSIWQLKRLSRAPRLVGSRGAVVQSLQKQLRYPTADIQAQRTGTVVLTCIIDEQGKVGLPIVTNAPSATLAQEVVRIVDKLSLHYFPGVYRGKRVQTKVSFVVRFCTTHGIKKAEIDSERQHEVQRQEQLVPSPPGSFNEVVVTALGAAR